MTSRPARIWFVEKRLGLDQNLELNKNFGLNTNLTYVSKLGEEGVAVYNYLYTSQTECHSVPDRDIFAK